MSQLRAAKVQIQGSDDTVTQEPFLLAKHKVYEPQHEIYNIVVCATSKASDQTAHMRSLIRAFASHLDTL